jgi:hypothetical protein
VDEPVEVEDGLGSQRSASTAAGDEEELERERKCSGRNRRSGVSPTWGSR